MPHTDASTHDGTTPKYLAGFRTAVRDLMGPHPAGWSATYNDEQALEQALRKAYQAGLLDGISAAHPSPSPGPVLDEDVVVVEMVVESFDTPAEPPVLASLVLPALGDTDPVVWAVRHARAVLGLSLVEGTEFVRETLHV